MWTRTSLDDPCGFPPGQVIPWFYFTPIPECRKERSTAWIEEESSRKEKDPSSCMLALTRCVVTWVMSCAADWSPRQGAPSACWAGCVLTHCGFVCAIRGHKGPPALCLVGYSEALCSPCCAWDPTSQVLGFAAGDEKAREKTNIFLILPLSIPDRSLWNRSSERWVKHLQLDNIAHQE